MSRPVTTLFMLMSLDGKINSGDNDTFDADRDWCQIDGVKEGLHQYYEIEQTTDLYSFNTGRTMAKIGVNDRTEVPAKSPCQFIILDRKPHLQESGVRYLCQWVQKLYLVTNNKNHPAYRLTKELDNLQMVYYDELNMSKMMEDLGEKYGVDYLTIQSGGTLNNELVRQGVVDYVHVVIAPLLVGGKSTNTLLDGKAISSVAELGKLKALELLEVNQLENSYLELKYRVKNEKEG